MKVKLGLSKQSRFTIWESGAWRPEHSSGYSFVCAAPDGGKLGVIYDTVWIDPSVRGFAKPILRELNHFCFFAVPGMIGVSTEIDWVEAAKAHTFQIRLVRFTGFKTNEQEDNEDEGYRVEYTRDLLWSFQGSLKTAHREREMVEVVKREYSEDTSGFNEGFRNLIEAGVRKATTVLKEQKLFWGEPRKESRVMTEVRTKIDRTEGFVPVVPKKNIVVIDHKELDEVEVESTDEDKQPADVHHEGSQFPSTGKTHGFGYHRRDRSRQ